MKGYERNKRKSTKLYKLQGMLEVKTGKLKSWLRRSIALRYEKGSTIIITIATITVNNSIITTLS